MNLTSNKVAYNLAVKKGHKTIADVLSKKLGIEEARNLEKTQNQVSLKDKASDCGKSVK